MKIRILTPRGAGCFYYVNPYQKWFYIISIGEYMMPVKFFFEKKIFLEAPGLKTRVLYAKSVKRFLALESSFLKFRQKEKKSPPNM